MLRKVCPLSLSIILCFSVCSFSQPAADSVKVRKGLSAHSLSIGAGLCTTDYLLDGYRPGRPTEFDYVNKGAPLSLNISYAYQVTRDISIGFTEVWEQEHGDWLSNEIPDGNPFDLQTTVKGEFIRTCFTSAATFRWDYASCDWYKLYLSFGLGYTYETETDQYNLAYYEQNYFNGANSLGAVRQSNNRAHVNAYLSPIGMSLGKRLSFFADFGFGYNGVVNTGLRFNLSKKKK